MTAYKHKSSIRADWSKNGRRVVLSCKKDNNKIREPHPLYERTVLVVVFGLQESLLHLPTSNPISITNRSILFVLYFNCLYGRCQVFRKPFYAKAVLQEQQILVQWIILNRENRFAARLHTK